MVRSRTPSTRAPSAQYVFCKLARRHKTALGVAAMLFGVLVLATGLITWQAVRAARAESLAKQRLAEAESARDEAESITRFLTEVFQSPDPARDGRTVTVAETLARAAQKIETDLASQPERRARLQAALGGTYLGLGLYPEAIAMQEKVRDYYLARLGAQNTNTLRAMQALAFAYDKAGEDGKAMMRQWDCLRVQGRMEGAEQLSTLQVMIRLAEGYLGAGRLTDE